MQGCRVVMDAPHRDNSNTLFIIEICWQRIGKVMAHCWLRVAGSNRPHSIRLSTLCNKESGV